MARGPDEKEIEETPFFRWKHRFVSSRIGLSEDLPKHLYILKITPVSNKTGPP